MVGAVLLLTGAARADDWPQWRGPNRNGTSAETGWLVHWPPIQEWKISVGEGWSSPVVSDGRLYAVGGADYTDTVSCFDAVTGSNIWTCAYAAGRRQNWWPRATPAVDGNRIYTLEEDHGYLHCIDRIAGTNVWTLQLTMPAQGDGHCESPVVEGDLLILDEGENGTAVNKYTGQVVWTSPDSGRHSSPFVFTWNAKRVAVIWGGRGVDALTGTLLWNVPAGTDVSGFPDCLLYEGDKLFVPGGGRSSMFSIQTNTLSLIWSSTVMMQWHNTPTLVGDYLYGGTGGPWGD